VNSPAPITLFLCGDVMTGRGIDQILPCPAAPRLHENFVTSALDYVRLAERANGPVRRPVDFAYVWGAALDEWRRAAPDVRIVNLETSVTRGEAYLPKGINYRMSPENVGCLLAADVDCCVLANNHVLDWGPDGLLDTLSTLQARGVKTAGAGRNLAEAAAPAILDIAGKGRVLVLALCMETSGVPDEWAAGTERPGVNLIELTEEAVTDAAETLEPIRRPGDVVVASIHWGQNWGYGIPEAHRRFAHALIDRAGVSVVHGHSSHHAKAIEVHKGKLVLYGCGDFLNDYEGVEGYEAYRDDLAVMYFATVAARTGELAELDMTPLQIRRLRLNRPAGEDIDWMARTLDEECGRFGSHVARAGDRLRLSWTSP